MTEQDIAPAERSDRPLPTARRRWVWVTVAVVAAVLLAGGAWAVWVRGGVQEGVPGPSDPTGYFSSGGLKPGRADFSLGTMHLRHPGKDVEVLAVKPLTSPNVEYLGAVAAWPRDIGKDGATYGGMGYPHEKGTRSYHPATGIVVPAAETAYIPPKWDSDEPPPVAVQAGFRLTSGPIGAVNGVRVVYTVDGDKKSAFFPHAVVVCMKDHPCREKGDSGFEDRVLQQFGLFAKGKRPADTDKG